MDTYQANPPPNAVLLFEGTSLDLWITRQGKPVGWTVEGGILQVAPGTGDILSRERFTDFFLHLEFRCPEMPGAQGQAKGNSGVFLQGRYEIQILDSYGIDHPGKRDCGAIYQQVAPLVNACKPPMEWQACDVIFRAARVRDTRVEELARLTLLQNGQVIHNNIQLEGVTQGAIDERVGEPGPLLLQDHGDRVAYRNIWAIHLPPGDSIPSY